MRCNDRQKGFTLIEILIVVVIMGVLAALIIPRLSNGPEKAMVGEANQMIGALMRAEQEHFDTTGSYLALGGNGDTNWPLLGLTAPAAVAKFTYKCDAASTCTAYRTANTNNTVIGTYTTNVISCGGVYTQMGNGGCNI